MKVAIYTRVSKADGTQDVTRQVNELRGFCKTQDWTIVQEITENVSGRRKKRAGTEKLVSLARANQIQKVVIHEISRFGRNALDVMKTVEGLTEAKVSVYELQQRQETLDEFHQKTTWATIILPLIAGFSEEWVKQHSYRIKSGLKQAIAEGKTLGRPKGHKLKKEDEVFRYLKQGKPIKETARLVGVARNTVRSIRDKRKSELIS